jgi:D-glycero-alpha-D-manno-heptose-7-phosphate kinase
MNTAVGRRVRATAPIRICDCGGWTDTWFADSGCVFNIAVNPTAQVTIVVRSSVPGADHVMLHVNDFDDHYVVAPDSKEWGPHPLLEAAIQTAAVPEDLSLDITLHCEMPAGASTGTSAAVTVALLAALDRVKSGMLSRKEIAKSAHAVEVEKLGLQSGVQDQYCAAFGGINFLTIPKYPIVELTSLPVRTTFARELEKRMLLIYLGTPHRSSEIHQRVIDDCAARGASLRALDRLRQAAANACTAVLEEDLEMLGAAMRENTAAQRELHPSLISADAEHIFSIADAFRYSGWKVNGAGGEGGSITLLSGENLETGRVIERLHKELPQCSIIPITLNTDGVIVEEEEIHETD